jgi:hypothetical protein
MTYHSKFLIYRILDKRLGVAASKNDESEESGKRNEDIIQKYKIYVLPTKLNDVKIKKKT